MDSPLPPLVAVSCAIYRILLLAYPRNFRREFGGEMAQVFCACCQDAYWRRGIVGLGEVCACTLLDTVGNVARQYALRERVQLLALPPSPAYGLPSLGEANACPFCGEEIEPGRLRCVYCAADLRLCPPQRRRPLSSSRLRTSAGYGAVQLATDARRFYGRVYGEPGRRD